MAVVPFKRPEAKKPEAPVVPRRSLGEFAATMAVVGVALFMLPMLWSGVSQTLLAVIHLLIAAVYFQQGPKIAAGVWIAATLVILALSGAPSPVTYAIFRALEAMPSAPR